MDIKYTFCIRNERKNSTGKSAIVTDYSGVYGYASDISTLRVLVLKAYVTQNQVHVLLWIFSHRGTLDYDIYIYIY